MVAARARRTVWRFEGGHEIGNLAWRCGAASLAMGDTAGTVRVWSVVAGALA